MQRGLVALGAAVLLTALTAPAAAAPADRSGARVDQTCAVVDNSTDEVRPGVVLTWDSSFRCNDAADEGAYDISVDVTNAASSSRAVEIRDLVLRHTTPRPRGQGPDATAEPQGLPVTVEPGQTRSFTVSGTYELVRTDEGDKANLHLAAKGDAAGRFTLGINVHLRG